jgi:hypothetical protein
MKCVLCQFYEADLRMAICLPCYVAKVLPLKTTRFSRYTPYTGNLE